MTNPDDAKTPATPAKPTPAKPNKRVKTTPTRPKPPTRPARGTDGNLDNYGAATSAGDPAGADARAKGVNGSRAWHEGEPGAPEDDRPALPAGAASDQEAA
jgi:hypothetical protein